MGNSGRVYGTVTGDAGGAEVDAAEAAEWDAEADAGLSHLLDWDL